MAKWLFASMLFGVRAMAQSVEGSVFDASTGNAIAGVKVELLRSTTPFYETTTDGGGRFFFENIPENDYSVRYQSPKYWLTAGPTDYRPFRVAAGSPVKLEVRLMPWSKISGRVVDARGNGVANARLELTGSVLVANGRTYARSSWGGGGGAALSTASLGMTHRGSTGANGEFDVQVMPGTYGLVAIPPADLKLPDRKPDGPALAWVRTYYPNAAAPEGASKIVVLPGGDVADVELKLLTVLTHVVRGVVLGSDGTPATGVAITQGEPGRAISIKSKSDGTFEFPAVPEGEASFVAEQQSGSVKLRAAEWVEVPRHDLENVKLRLAAPLTIRGKVIVEGPKDTLPPKPPALLLAVRGGRSRQDGEGAPGAGVVGIITPDARGDFLVQDAFYPGVYWLPQLLQQPPPPYYLEAVRVGEADLLTQDVEFSSDVAITIVYRADSGSVSGKAENCGGGGVLLIPQDPGMRRRGYSKSGACDGSDRYQVQGVRPGEYSAIGFAGNGPVLPVDETLLKQATKVTVRSGTDTTADVQTVTRPVF